MGAVLISNSIFSPTLSCTLTGLKPACRESSIKQRHGILPEPREKDVQLYFALLGVLLLDMPDFSKKNQSFSLPFCSEQATMEIEKFALYELRYRP